jgi:hypothetical protein
MTIIAFTGLKGSGKDTAAKVLLNRGYANLKFADPLKDMLRLFLRMNGVYADIVERMIEGDLKETPTAILGGKTPRWALQSLGTEWGRDLIYENVWTDTFIRRVKQLDKVVCTDFRFPNERDVLKFLGAKLIRITRPDQEQNVHSLHPSEIYITQMAVDHEIINDSSIDALWQRVALVTGERA